MKFLEFTNKSYIRGKKVALAVVFVAEDPKLFDSQFKELKAGIEEWRVRSKTFADLIWITIVTDELLESETKTYFESAINAPEYATSFGQVPITISLQEKGSQKLLSEINIRGGEASVNAKYKGT